MALVTGITSTITSRYVSHQLLREKEAELLFRGLQYINAIQSFYEYRDFHVYPRTLDDLLRDSRAVSEKHIRRLYADPFRDPNNNSNDLGWRLIRDDGGFIIGVASQSHLRPIKQAAFQVFFIDFDNSEKYSDWEFIYRPKLNR
ncbi:hypothetical protein [Sessilibacter sp. MAH2]